MTAAGVRGSRGPWRDGLRRFRRNRAAAAAVLMIVALALVAIFADAIAPYGVSEQLLERSGAPLGDPLAPRSTGKFEAPSLDHLFGTDQLARDIFSRTLVGLRISLAAALFAMVVVTLIGVSVGTLAAVGPRWFDDTLMRCTDVAYGFPDLLLMILLSSALGDSVFGAGSVAGVDARLLLLFLAISLTAWPTTARLVRGQLLAIREMEFAIAAEALGASPWRRVSQHLLPNAMGPVFVEAAFLVPRAIVAEATPPSLERG